MPQNSLEFRMLGPLEAVRDGRAVPLSRQKLRALLAVLLLDANRVVSTDRLLDTLWAGRPPPAARSALHGLVSQLRRLLAAADGTSPVHSTPPGYLLEVDADGCDAARFERLAAAGRDALQGGDAAGAAGLLREALSLWRGAPLADLAFEDFVALPASRLEEQRLQALEDRLDADLQVGAHAGVVAELEALTAAHPLRERTSRLLVLALYRCERQADALAAQRAATGRLRDGLGIDPSPALARLEAALLRQDPELDAPPASSGPAPSPAPRRSTPAPVEPVPAERRTVTVVHCVLQTTGPGGPSDPEVLQPAISALRRVAERTAAAHGGALVGTPGGSSATIAFGLDGVREDDAWRALHAGRAIGAAVLESTGAELRTGVEAGELLAGGSSAVGGGPVDAAALLAGCAPPGSVLVGERAAALARGVAGLADWPPIAGGRVHRLVSLSDEGHIRRSARGPFVGRDGPLALLQGLLERAASEPSCHVVTLVGEAGIGKSRLCAELLAGAGDVRVLQARCLHYGEGITFWPLRDLLRESVGSDLENGIAALLDGDPRAGAVAGVLAEAAGAGGQAGDADERAWALRRVLATLATRCPLVIVVDDLQWAEPPFVDLLERVVDGLRALPVVLLCLARPELLDLRPDWQRGRLDATTLVLDSLPAAACEALVAALLDGAPTPPSLAAALAGHAHGNPLFAEELVAALREDGRLARGPAGWELDGEIAVPPTVQALIAARLDRLPASERGVLARAAVEGQLFHRAALPSLGRELSGVDEPLRALLRKDLLRPAEPAVGSGEAYRFRHLLIRDAAYASLPKRDRAQAHEGFARWLTQAAGGDETAELRGYHLELAANYRAELGEPDQVLERDAGRVLAAAGGRAFGRGDSKAAVDLLGRGVQLLASAPPERVAALPALGDALIHEGRLAEAESLLLEALAADDLVVRLGAAAPLTWFLAYSPSVDHAVLQDLAARAIPVLEEQGDDRGLAIAWFMRAGPAGMSCRMDEARHAFERALVHAEKAGERRVRRNVIEWLAGTLYFDSTPEPSASARMDDLLAAAQGSPALEAHVLSKRANLHAIAGRAEQAEADIARAFALLDELGDAVVLGLTQWGAGDASFQLGEIERARERLDAAIATLAAMGENAMRSQVVGGLGIVALECGDDDEAERLGREMRAITEQGDIAAEGTWRPILASVHARRGELDAALALSAEAVALTDDVQQPDLRALALVARGEALAAAGDSTWTATIDEAAALLEAKGHVMGLRRALGLRDRLAGRAAARS